MLRGGVRNVEDPDVLVQNCPCLYIALGREKVTEELHEDEIRQQAKLNERLYRRQSERCRKYACSNDSRPKVRTWNCE